MAGDSKRVLLFDGVCNFCNASVLFVLDRDPHERFLFAALQSDVGIETLRKYGLKDLPLSTVVVIEDGKAYLRSDAALRVAKGLRWPWPVLYYLLRWLPRSFRDAAYGAFAKRRYALFGKSDQCRIPTPELRRRLLA